MRANRFSIRFALVAAIALLLPFVRAAAEAPPDAEVFTANVIAMGGPATGMARLRATVERWTTDEERKVLATALAEKGTDGLVAAMEEITVGYLQVDQSLRWPIRTAATWTTDKGRMVRFATNRPVFMAESMRGTRSLDYPIGVIEFLLPPEGPGEGALLAATKVQFDASGRIEVTSTPHNTGPQKLTNVRIEVPKPKKEKPDKPEE